MWLIMKAKDFIYHHLFGMKAKRLAGMERNNMGWGEERKQIGANKHKFRPQIGTKKENNTQEFKSRIRKCKI